ncbi:MAG: hypothetical protein ACI9TB_001061 [Parasphingorhabdus sp.]|jgi:hypothetical protein
MLTGEALEKAVEKASEHPFGSARQSGARACANGTESLSVLAGSAGEDQERVVVGERLTSQNGDGVNDIRVILSKQARQKNAPLVLTGRSGQTGLIRFTGPVPDRLRFKDRAALSWSSSLLQRPLATRHASGCSGLLT